MLTLISVISLRTITPKEPKTDIIGTEISRQCHKIHRIILHSKTNKKDLNRQ